MAADVAVDGSLRFLEHDRPQPVGAPPTYDVRVALDDGSGKLPASASLEVARLTVFLASLFALSVSCGWRRGEGGGPGGGTFVPVAADDSVVAFVVVAPCST